MQALAAYHCQGIPTRQHTRMCDSASILQEGYGEFQVYHDRGERADMNRQYLRPAMGRSNLTVVTGAQTQHVAFEKHSSRPRARGVVFSIGGPDGHKHSGELKAPHFPRGQCGS